MASLATSMFATESSSAFLGTALLTGEAVSAKSRVSMSYNRQELERKPLVLLRTLARKAQVTMTSKQAIIDALMKKGTYSYSPDLAFSTPSSSAAPASGDAAKYNALSLGELRTLAKERGLRADTKAELVKLLLESPAPAAVSYSSPAPTPSAPVAGLPKAVLERKSLSELRALARIRGLRGDTKAELVKLLSADGGASSSSAPSTNGAASYSAPSYSNGATIDNTVETGYQYTTPNSVVIRQLSVKSLSQLRAMASIKGIRGGTKHELVQQLAALA